jgi:hypothetical protein
MRIIKAGFVKNSAAKTAGVKFIKNVMLNLFQTSRVTASFIRVTAFFGFLGFTKKPPYQILSVTNALQVHDRAQALTLETLTISPYSDYIPSKISNKH